MAELKDKLANNPVEEDVPYLSKPYSINHQIPEMDKACNSSSGYCFQVATRQIAAADRTSL